MYVPLSKQVFIRAKTELPECDTLMNQVDVAMVASNIETSMKIESSLSDPKGIFSYYR